MSIYKLIFIFSLLFIVNAKFYLLDGRPPPALHNKENIPILKLRKIDRTHNSTIIHK